MPWCESVDWILRVVVRLLCCIGTTEYRCLAIGRRCFDEGESCGGKLTQKVFIPDGFRTFGWRAKWKARTPIALRSSVYISQLLVPHSSIRLRINTRFSHVPCSVIRIPKVRTDPGRLGIEDNVGKAVSVGATESVPSPSSGVVTVNLLQEFPSENAVSACRN